ncbi:MAG: Signal transduction histidine kinase [Pedosphaera sp.]|nr:Signal transduction histidine kinase [Pedosphaera sp.]
MLGPASELRPFSRMSQPSPTEGAPSADNNFPTFKIDFAFQGQEALACVRAALAEDYPYTMAFMDVRMPPGWDGIETIGHIWKECFDLQIVICTGHADFSWHDLIRRFGHSDRLLILKKPFDMTELRQVAYSLAEKWDLTHQARSHLERLQKLVGERTARLQEANVSLQRKVIENHQAERRLVTQYAVSVALAQATTLAGAVEIIFQIVCRSLNWDWGALWEVDVPANVLKLTNFWHVSESGLEDYAGPSRNLILDPGIGLPGRAWNTGQSVWTRDVFLEEQSAWASDASKHGLHGGIAFPLTAGGKVFGVLEFLSRDIEERNQDMLQTFAVIGSAIGQFIERRQAGEDLKRERDYVEQIIRETPALVVGIGPDGTITFVNPSTARNTGYPAEELIGKDWWRLFYPGEEYGQVEQLFRDLANGPVRDYEMILTTKTGTKRTVSWNSLSKYDDEGKLTELIGFGNDITDRKRAELERRSMELQLRHAQKMESIGQLSAGIAHEINTPTQYLGDNIRFLQTSFGGLSELHVQYENLFQTAKQNAVTPALLSALEETRRQVNVDFLLREIPDAIQQSLEGVDRVTRIVRAMKDFSHPGTAEKTPIDLNKAIETTMTVAGNEWKYVAKIATDFDKQLPMVPCLPGEFNQVILNLVVNATHAIADVVGTRGKAMGLITASTRRCGDWVEIRIKDTGTGIPESIRDKVFDPFFTTKPVGKGTGQGLAIAHAVIVDQHQGQLTFETEMGAGTAFIIRLPLNPPPALVKTKLHP